LILFVRDVDDHEQRFLTQEASVRRVDQGVETGLEGGSPIITSWRHGTLPTQENSSFSVSDGPSMKFFPVEKLQGTDGASSQSKASWALVGGQPVLSMAEQSTWVPLASTMPVKWFVSPT